MAEDEKKYDVPGGNVTIDADGDVHIDHEIGTARIVDGEFQPIEIKGPIAAIGIKTIVDVERHDIKQDATAISHNIAFRNGGSARITYTPEGRLIEFRTEKTTVSVDKTDAGNVICVGQLTD